MSVPDCKQGHIGAVDSSVAAQIGVDIIVGIAGDAAKGVLEVEQIPSADPARRINIRPELIESHRKRSALGASWTPIVDDGQQPGGLRRWRSRGRT